MRRLKKEIKEAYPEMSREGIRDLLEHYDNANIVLEANYQTPMTKNDIIKDIANWQEMDFTDFQARYNHLIDYSNFLLERGLNYNGDTDDLEQLIEDQFILDEYIDTLIKEMQTQTEIITTGETILIKNY